MPETTTGTTQTPPAPAATTTTPPPAQTTTPPGQGTAGATTTPPPSQISTEQTVQTPPATTQPVKLPPEEVQKRIDRMYARLQKEREQRLAAEAQLATRPHTQTTTDDDDVTTTPPSLTERDVVDIVERKERDKRFISSEMRVFEQHPDALNEDGSFNMSSPFVQKYIDIGRRNPMLAAMENGPEMAAAMADKESGFDYRKGRVDEATRLTTQHANNFTTSSTVATPPIGTVEINDTEKRIARRMGLTDKQYLENKASNKVQQKSWEVK